MDEIMKASAPLVEYLEKNCDPYTYVVVSMDSVKVMKTEFCTPITKAVSKD